MVDEESSRAIVVSVDVEPDAARFASGFAGLMDGLPRLADLFREVDVPADYFFTVDAAQQVPDFLRDQAAHGGWFGSHGVHHTPALYGRQPTCWQERTIDDATEGLTALAGNRPRMFRSPNFSVSRSIVRTLDDLGYDVDSSVLPGRIKRRFRVFPAVDHRGAPREPYHPDGRDPCKPGDLRLWEIPVTENPRAPGGPIGLGFVHAEGAENALHAVRESSGRIVTILCHTWEAVDLCRLYPSAPPWLAESCNADLRSMRAFLRSLRSQYEFRSFRSVVQALREDGGDPA